MHCDAHVVRHRKIPEQAYVLECAGNADFIKTIRTLFIYNLNFISSVPERNLSFGRNVQSAEHIEYSRFSCAVRTDKTYKLACIQIKIKITHGAQSAEYDRKVGSLKYQFFFVSHH